MMKKCVVFMLLIFSGFFVVNAQDVNFGAKAGLNVSTLPPGFTESRTSFHLGAVAEIVIGDNFSLQPELLYSGQGSKDQDDSDDNEIYRVDYLSIPILAKYYVTDALSVEGGPQLGFLLSAEAEDNGETVDIKDTTKSTDFGFALGAGYKLESGLNFGLRYFFGSDVNDIDEDADEFKNRVFQLSIGYFF